MNKKGGMGIIGIIFIIILVLFSITLFLKAKEFTQQNKYCEERGWEYQTGGFCIKYVKFENQNFLTKLIMHRFDGEN